MPDLYLIKSKILTLSVILGTILFLPLVVNAGVMIPAPVTDMVNSRMIGYWDLRDRESYFQVTNESSSDIRVHIQIYDAGNDCIEFNYYDTLTPRDTHLYDISSLDRNNGAALSAPDLSGGHGIIAVTHVDSSDVFDPEPVITGNFRIFDQNGYQYRTNFAGDRTLNHQMNGLLGSPPFRINFDGAGEDLFSDLVIIPVSFIDNPGGVIPFSQPYEFTLYDDNENPISCPPAVLGCLDEFIPFTLNGESLINVGINQSVTNSRGGPSVCLGTDTTGFLEISTGIFLQVGIMQQSLIDPSAHHHFVFSGQNSGSGLGSMDSAIQTNYERNIDP